MRAFNIIPGGLEPACVAIVDDDGGLRDAVDSLLRSVGFRVEAFASAEAFLASPMLAQTACVVLDVGLPGMSGLQLQAHLNRGGHRLPVVFVTAAHDRQGWLHAQVAREGARAFLPKPFAGDDLLSAVSAVCSPRA